MRYLLTFVALCVADGACAAGEPEAGHARAASTVAAVAAAPATPVAAVPTAAVPAAAAPITNVSKSDEAPADGKQPAQFTTDAKWETAGYNNDEIVYTILVTSHDSRIIRCTTSLQGAYFENGQKQAVSDRQLSTVFPDQQVQVGNWMGMDQQSGATYSVHCHSL